MINEKNETRNMTLGETGAKVAVLLSTYNGEKYLDEQMESLLGQRGVEISVFIRDDGSSERTISIIHRYSQEYKNIVFLEDSLTALGPGKSFFSLLAYAGKNGVHDYYAYCDQDDIWGSDKLETAVRAIGESERPALYCSNQTLYIDGKNEGLRYHVDPPIDMVSLVSRNPVAGCTMVFNRALAKKILTAGEPSEAVLRYKLHDAWTMLSAGYLDAKVVYDKTPHILYRIHAENTVGIKNMPLKTRYERLTHSIRAHAAGELIRLYPEASAENKRVVGLFANYKNSFRDKLALIKSEDVRGKVPEKRLRFVVKVLLGLA